MKDLKQKILAGETVHGTWVNLGSVVSTEILGNAGFDWLLIDLEHGAGADVMYSQLQALEGTPATPIVRTNELLRSSVQRILDAGAAGVMFPRIETPAETETAISMLYYPPKGTRGMARMIRASGFGKTVEQYEEMQKNVIGIIQIETMSALKQIEEIAAIDGVDILFVGPSDLSMALGNFGKFDHPDFRDTIKKVGEVAKKFKKTAGVLLQDIKEYEMYHSLGYHFLALSGDAAFVAKSARQTAQQLDDLRKQYSNDPLT